MRLAWFRPASAAFGGFGAVNPHDHVSPHDDTALLVRGLATRHEIALIDERRAHDFVWQQARNPVDLCVYELDGTPAHQFMAAYAVHYPGIVLLRGVPRHDHALLASRLIVVPHEPVAQALADDYPGTRVRTLVPGVEPLSDEEPSVIVALRWPPDGAALTRAMAGFGASRAVIVFDGPETADWPSLDPQNWQPRMPVEHAGTRLRREPICVSIDPRDEAHSLRLATRRLAEDAALRERLGAAAHAWWRAHATVEIAAAGFEALLEEARTFPHASAVEADDGTGHARRILASLGFGIGDLGFEIRDSGLP